MRLFLCLLVLLMLSCSPRKITADLIIHGGKIYTLDEQHSTVEAVVVKSDTIVYAGNLEGAESYKGETTRMIDLATRVMTPGLIESHGHLMALGYGELRLHLDTIKSYDELVEKVKVAVAGAAPGEWIVGRGWHQDKWPVKPSPLVAGFQTNGRLNEVSPDNPVYLEHVSGHAVFVNKKALEIAGLLPLSRERLSREKIPSGEIIRDELGNPTGILIDNAKDLVGQYIPQSTAGTDEKALSLAIAACLRNGITSFHDASTNEATLALYRKFKSIDQLTTRIYVMLEGTDSKSLDDWFRRGPEIDATHRLTIRAIKLHGDGALGTRSAWLLEPYSDRPGTSGFATLSMDSLSIICRNALKSGFQICTHAIGDRTNREVLDRYERAFVDNPAKAKDHRFRIEHAQHLNPADIPRFGKLGVIASMQAIHLSSDRPWAIDRLGKKRIEEGAYVWQSLLKSGAKVINGTDVPVEPINPVACFYASVTRKTLTGKPDGGYEPWEKMTREQALRSYTLDAVFGAFEEKFKGSIEKGKLADFTIFSQDLMTVPDENLLKTKVVMTVIGGKVVFDALK